MRYNDAVQVIGASPASIHGELRASKGKTLEESYGMWVGAMARGEGGSWHVGRGGAMASGAG